MGGRRRSESDRLATSVQAGGWKVDKEGRVAISHETVEKATREVLETSASTRVHGAKHHNEADRNFAELVGSLSLLGKLGGTLVIYCAWPQAVSLTTNMLGGGPEPDRETVHDAMGEVVNQIGGTIKRSIGADGTEILLSPPLVVSGSPLEHCVKSTSEPMSVEVQLESGPLFVCLWPS
jgi:CheY-specific phosphatase CheX